MSSPKVVNRLSGPLANGLLVLVANAYASAFADTQCLGDWRHEATLIGAQLPSGSSMTVPLNPSLLLEVSLDGAFGSLSLTDQYGQTIPHRAIAAPLGVADQSSAGRNHFVFGPDVLDPALNPGLSASSRPDTTATVEPTPGMKGFVWLSVTPSANPSEAEHYTFKACAHWRYGPASPETEHYPSPDALNSFPSWVVLAFERCGLDQRYLLSGRLSQIDAGQRSWLEPDLDADGLHDLVALIQEPIEARPGLAICTRADRTLTLVWLEDEFGPDISRAHFFREFDQWAVDGASVFLSRGSSDSVRIFQDLDGEFAAERVTPD